jgi:hypothetical protein
VSTGFVVTMHLLAEFLEYLVLISPRAGTRDLRAASRTAADPHFAYSKGNAADRRLWGRGQCTSEYGTLGDIVSKLRIPARVQPRGIHLEFVSIGTLLPDHAIATFNKTWCCDRFALADFIRVTNWFPIELASKYHYQHN